MVARHASLKYIILYWITRSAKVQDAKALGFTHGKYEGNDLQLPAKFIIGPDHTIEYAYFGTE